MKFTFTVTKQEIDKAYDSVIAQAVKNTTLKGFRKGQAPKDLVIKSIGEVKLQQEAIEHALPQAYTAEVKKKKLSPVSYPTINLKSGKPGEDFVFEAEIAELPEIKLGDYQSLLKGEFSKSKIWKPGEELDNTDTTQKASEDQLLDKIAKLLLDNIKVDVPQLLVDREVNRMLSRLLDQVNNLGLKIDDYLASTNQTKESLRQDYEKSASQSLALEFILMEIAKDLKIEASETEVNQFISSVGDKKLAAQLEKPEEKANLFVMLTKQNVIQRLKQLAQ